MGWELCWRCESHKPHRAHHCYQCRTCILKRDHHCIFAVNCVGHANMRYAEKFNVRDFFLIFEKKFNFRKKNSFDFLEIVNIRRRKTDFECPQFSMHENVFLLEFWIWYLEVLVFLVIFKISKKSRCIICPFT